MNEIIREQNLRDLKLYRMIIAAVLLCSIVIGTIVGISTSDTFTAQANATNGFLTLVMPKHIDAIDQTGEGAYTNGMTFYREKNKDYKPKEDEPVRAFNYYYLTEDGKRIDLENGNYYPPEYYDETKDVSPVPVYLGFYIKAMDNIKIVKNVIKVIVGIVVVALIFFGIYVWYLSWRKREEERVNRNKNNY